MRNLKILFTLVIVLAVSFMSYTPAQAGPPAGGWASGIACQNLDPDTEASVRLEFYREGQSTAESVFYETTISAGGSRNWLTTSASSMANFPTNFTGSAVISSSTQLACNLNTQSTGVGTTGSPFRLGTASGFNENQASSVMYIPQVLKGAAEYQSYFAVQNISNAPVSISVKYYGPTGAEVTAAAETAVIPGQSMKVFYQSDNAGLPAGFNGGAKVTATDPVDTKLAVLVAIYKDGADYTRAQFLSYNGVAGGASTVFVPRFVRKLLGNNSGLAIQNVSDVATNVTVSFNFQGQTYTVTSPTPVQPQTSWLLYAPNITEIAAVDALAEGLRQGSAVITTSDTNARVVATVNESNPNGTGSTYNAINNGDQTQSVFFAQFTKNAAGGVFTSGLQVSNTTNTPGTCNIEYAGQPAINEANVPLPANGTIIRWGRSGSTPSMAAMMNNYNAAVKVSCTVDVTGIVNMAAYGSYFGDSFTQTGALNQ